MDDYRRLVTEVHRRGMKIYLDQEMQYVAHDHAWWAEPRADRASQWSDYILWDDRAAGVAEEGPFGLREATGFDGRTTGITTVNLHSPEVHAYFERYFLYWVDPNGDGDFSDGVDGFRIDHMMDDLDNKGLLTDLFARFWRPLFARLRAVNPNVRIIAEQADWGYGDDYLARGDVDCVFAFPLRNAIVSSDRAELVRALAETAQRTPEGRCNLVFLENHDMNRFATEVESAPQRLRLGAALNVLLQGTPILYYGQELGMRGRAAEDYGTDANHIPLREAFRWRAALDAPGSALWYRSDAPWWRERFNRDRDGVSVQEQDRDRASLLNFYRRLLRLRRERPELSQGDQRILPTEGSALALLRTHGGERSLLIANFSPRATASSLDVATLGARSIRPLVRNGAAARLRHGRIEASLDSYGVMLLELR
jgi:glycosidase